MADSTDVCNALKSIVLSAVNPLVGQTFTIPSAIDAATYGLQTVPMTTVMLSRPLQKDLEDRLGKSLASISIEPSDKDMSAEQYANEGFRQDFVSKDPITLTVTPGGVGSSNTYTFGGTITAGNIVGVQCGFIGASYVVQVSDTIASVVSALATNCVDAGFSASGSGNVLTVAAESGPAIVVVDASSTWLVGTSRAARNFEMMLWMPDPFIRQYLLKAIEPHVKPGMKLVMPDGSQASILGKHGPTGFDTRTNDKAGRDNLFLAITSWHIEFVVTEIIRKSPVVATTVTFDMTNVDPRQPIPANML